MTREILFRGKRTDTGDWVYGDYCSQDSEHEALIGVWNKLTRSCDWIPVYASTVGQFTGLHDKDGNKIFEGDIFSRNTFVGLVVYYRGCWFLEWEQNGITSRVILGDGDTASGNVIGHKITNP